MTDFDELKEYDGSDSGVAVMEAPTEETAAAAEELIEEQAEAEFAAPASEQAAPAAEQAVPDAQKPVEEAQPEEGYDVDIGYDMEWEVETEPAVEPEPEPVTETITETVVEEYYGPTYQPDYDGRYRRGYNDNYGPGYDDGYGQGYDRGYGQGYDQGYGRGYGYGQRPVVRRRMNKHVFTWIGSFLLGIYGVDRFMRGQVALGLFKLFTFGGFGFWYIADAAIAIFHSYAGPYRYSDDVTFDQYGRYIW